MGENELETDLDSYGSVDDLKESFQVLSYAETIAEVQYEETEDDSEEEEEYIVCPRSYASHHNTVSVLPPQRHVICCHTQT